MSTKSAPSSSSSPIINSQGLGAADHKNDPGTWTSLKDFASGCFSPVWSGAKWTFTTIKDDENVTPLAIKAGQISMIAGALQPTLGNEGCGLAACAWYIFTKTFPEIYPWAVDNKQELRDAMNQVFNVSSFVGGAFSSINLYKYVRAKKLEQDNTVNMKKALEAMKKMNKTLAKNEKAFEKQIATLKAELNNNTQNGVQSMQAMMQEHTEASDSKLALLASELARLQKALMPDVVPSGGDAAPVLPVGNENVLSEEAVIPAALVGEQDQAPAEVLPQNENKSEEVPSGSSENDSQS